jgi:WD40 repeat protein
MMVLTLQRKKKPWPDVGDLTFSPDGTRLLAVGTGVAYPRPSPPPELWDATAGKRVATLSAGVSHSHPSGRWLFASDDKGRFVAHDLQTGETRATSVEGFRVGYPQPTPDGRRVVFNLRPPTGWDTAGIAIHKWTPDGTLGPGRTIPPPPKDGPLSSYSGPHLLPDGERFAAHRTGLGDPPRVTLFSLADGSALSTTTLDVQDRPLLAVAPDGSRYAAAIKTVLFAWDDPGGGAAPRVAKNDGRKQFTAIAWHPSGTYLAATSNDETVKLFDTRSWAVAKTYTWDVGRLRGVCFAPDGLRAAVGSDTGQVVVFDLDL